MTNKEKFIALVDNDLIIKSDVIVLLEGDGKYRCQKAVDLLNNEWAEKIIFSGGIKDYDYGSFPLEDLLPEFKRLGLDTSKIIHEDKSLNTYEQACNVIQMAINENWNSIILVATHDHQYRAYLTFLKQIIDKKLNILLINSPVRNLPWFKETNWGLRIDRLEEEFNKIDFYIRKNHVCTYEEAIEYQIQKENFILNNQWK